MMITKPEVKAFIYNIIMNEDLVDESGSLQRRKLFKKEFLKDFLKLKKNLSEHAFIGWVDRSNTEPKFEDLNWTKLSEWKSESNKKVLSEKWSEEALDLSSSEKKMINTFYSERENVPEISIEALEEFEEIIK